MDLVRSPLVSTLRWVTKRCKTCVEIVELDQSPRKSMQIQAGQAGGQMKRLFEKEKKLENLKICLDLRLSPFGQGL